MVSDDIILYDIEEIDKKFQFDLTLKEIIYTELSSYTDAINCLLQYQNLLADYTGNGVEGFGVEKA